MRLSALAVTNHSRISDLALEVRQHAVIVGANDVGKSSLLRLLNLTLGASTGTLYQRLDRGDLADTNSPLVVDVTFASFTDAERALFTSEIHVAEDGVSESLSVRLLVEQDPDDEEAIAVRRWFPRAGHERAPSSKQIEGFGWRYLPATRNSNAASLEGRDSAFRALLGATDLGEQRVTLAGLLEQFNAALASSGNIVDLLERVANHLSRAMPKPVVEDDIAIRSTADPETDVLGNVSLYVKKDGAHVPFTHQSDGVRQLTAMTLFDLAEGTANVVAIDEPELHLHPSSQRTIAELFASASNQKILATHSAYVVHRFEPSHVIAVDPDGKCHQIAEDRLSIVEKQRVNWWSPRLLETLTARAAIVVEGASDRVIVEAAARAMGIELDRLGAVVFDIDGADKFPHVYKLIGKDGFGVQTLGLVDAKEKGSWLNAFGGRPNDVVGTSLWVSDSDLEAEYARAFTGPRLARALVDAGYCRQAAVLQSAGASTFAEVTDEAVAAFCRKGKTEVAAVVASQLDAATAGSIASVAGLLNALTGQDLR